MKQLNKYYHLNQEESNPNDVCTYCYGESGTTNTISQYGDVGEYTVWCEGCCERPEGITLSRWAEMFGWVADPEQPATDEALAAFVYRHEGLKLAQQVLKEVA